MKLDELEDWSLRVMQTMQGFCDDAQVAAGEPDGEGELIDVRLLMMEYERMAQGQPRWSVQLTAMSEEEKAIFDRL